jgi:hypothetical protein
LAINLGLVQNMRWRTFGALVVVFAPLALGTGSVFAQSFPAGSYEQSCRQVHWAGKTLVAECPHTDGRFSGTGLADAGRCHGDIANIDGQLRCIAGGPPPAQGYAPPPGQGYPSPPGAPGYPVGGGPPPGPGWDEHRAHCEELWRHENELRERIEYAPLGPDRDRLQYRSDEVHQELERQGCGR